MTEIYTKLIAWLNEITPDNCTVIARNPNAPEPSPPFVSLKVISQTNQATNFTGVDDDGIRLATRFYGLVASLQIQGRQSVPLEAEDLSQLIMDALRFPEQLTDFLGRDLTFTKMILGPQSLDKISSIEWNNRTVMDIGFNATREILQDVGVIEIVETEGTIGTVEINRRIEL